MFRVIFNRHYLAGPNKGGKVEGRSGRMSLLEASRFAWDLEEMPFRTDNRGDGFVATDFLLLHNPPEEK